jgi:hypothetical protein
VFFRRLQQRFSATRFAPGNDPAGSRKAGMSQALDELVAGGFEIHLLARPAAASRGHK